jgi:hypothetical protein
MSILVEPLQANPELAREANLELRYIDGHTVRFYPTTVQGGGFKTALVPVFRVDNPLEKRMAILTDAPEIDFSADPGEINAIQDGYAVGENTGWDVYILIKDDFTSMCAIACPMDEDLDDEDLPAGWGSIYRSQRIRYVCLNSSIDGDFVGVTPFCNLGNKTIYRGVLDEHVVLLNEATTNIYPVLFQTVAAAQKAQTPSWAKVVNALIRASNVNASLGQLNVFLDGGTTMLFQIRGVGTAAGVNRKTVNVKVPLRGTWDTSLYLSWSGAPGAPRVNVDVMSYEL